MIPCNRMKTIISLLLLLAVVKLIHCQDHEQMIVLTLQGILQNLESINGQLKDVQQELGNQKTNFQELHHELEHVKGLSQETGQLVRREVLEHLTNVSAAAKEEIKSYVHEEISGVISLAQGHDELLQRIPDMQEKLQHLENNLQGLSRETAQCLKGEDLEHLTNVSAAANQEIKSFHEEMSEVISLAQKDECSEGSLLCGQLGTCENTLFSFTCSCPSGFTWDGSECKDVDECAEGKDDCVPNATCKNSIGSYSCSCNKHFEGDGITSCEFQCLSPAKVINGLGCIRLIKKRETFADMADLCQEEGMRLVQHASHAQLTEMVDGFRYHDQWVGVYDGKWMSDESLVPEDLWEKGYIPDSSKLCGFVTASHKLKQAQCSNTGRGYCQFQMP
ncbi:protein kinase C-binding protein NELL2a-like isoform X3 [Palaemon carinicauda]|uniref:protein kinase C-binding protein NELL2a-like isoform X3 n=1 Tax=Palaemon carinicauda TaxID=392227 RepID=UPI0035B579C2